MEKPEGKRATGIPRRRWEISIKMDLKARGWNGVNLIHLVDDMDTWRDSSDHGNAPAVSLK